MNKRTPVFMEHDGAIDDLLSQMLLLTMEDKVIIGINVTPADCYIEPALESSYKILQVFQKEEIPLGRSEFNGINAFPNEWRAKPEIINALPDLINLPSSPNPYTYKEATELLINQLSLAQEQVEIIITGPCTNLVKALEINPCLRTKIKQVVWMGGAFRIEGNVQTYQHNGTAEWNVYWDSMSSAKLLSMELPLICVPLDVTNKVPVNKEFLSLLAKQSNKRLANLAGQFWALTIDTIPSYHYVYFMWDVLATSYLAIPDVFKVEDIKAKVSTRPPNAGQTEIDENGFRLKILVDVDLNKFYDYILKSFSEN